MKTKMIDASDYAILFDKREGEFCTTELGAMRTRTIRAGDSLEAEVFPITKIGEDAKREAKKRRSSPAQERLNRKRTAKRIRRLAETNFVPPDLHLTLTYDYGRLDPGMCNLEDMIRFFEESDYPFDDEDVKRHLKNFLRRLKRRIKANGHNPKELKYIYVIESTKEARIDDPHPLPPHYHVHLLIHAPGVGREEIEALWGFGYANAKRLDFSRNGLEALCNYLTKQKNCTHRWGHSRNLKEPEVRVSDRKVSRRRAAMVARDVQYNGREISEAIYPGYRVEEVEVRYSDFVAGAYIYARMRRQI